MAGLPLVEIYQKFAKGFGNIISGDDTFKEDLAMSESSGNYDAVN